jgi:hypothetical protein
MFGLLAWLGAFSSSCLSAFEQHVSIIHLLYQQRLQQLLCRRGVVTQAASDCAYLKETAQAAPAFLYAETCCLKSFDNFSTADLPWHREEDYGWRNAQQQGLSPSERKL